MPRTEPGSRRSPREREVLARLAHGFSNAAIAAALSLALSEGTVKTHITGLIKLEARERLQAAVLAHRAGIVSPP